MTTSKKYILHPFHSPKKHHSSSLPHHSLRGHSPLATNSASAAELKQREFSSPYSPFSYSYTDFEQKDDCRLTFDKTEEYQSKELPPSDLTADLKKLRDYKKNERKFAKAILNVFVHPFQYISASSEDSISDFMRGEPPDTNAADVDYAQWKRDMSSKLGAKKRQIRLEKKRAEREKQSAEGSSSSSKKHKSERKERERGATLFNLGRKKKKEDEYDTLERKRRPRRVMTARELSSAALSDEETDNSPVKLSRVYSHQYHKNDTKASSETRLFQQVRSRSVSISDDAAPSSFRSTPSSPIKAFSFKSRRSPNTAPSTPSPSFLASDKRSERDLNIFRKMSRNSVGVANVVT